MSNKITIGGYDVITYPATFDAGSRIYAIVYKTGSRAALWETGAYDSPELAIEAAGEWIASKTLYYKLKAGETVNVRSRSNGSVFEIRPEHWEGIQLGYSVIVAGEVARTHNGLMLDNEQLADWCNQLEEVPYTPTE